MQVTPPTPSNSDLTIVGNADLSASGYNVYLGPSLATAVSGVVSSKCQTLNSPNCQSSIQIVISRPQLNLRSRAVGIDDLAAGVLFALIEVIYRIYHVLEPNYLKHIHILAPDVRKISSASAASTLVFGTATDDPNMVTVVVSSEAAAASTAGGALAIAMRLVSSLSILSNSQMTILEPDLDAVILYSVLSPRQRMGYLEAM